MHNEVIPNTNTTILIIIIIHNQFSCRKTLIFTIKELLFKLFFNKIKATLIIIIVKHIKETLFDILIAFRYF